MIREFKEFIMRGNVIDLAVAFVMGAAFGKVVTSFVNDILMPPIGLLLGKINFSDMYVNLSGTSYSSLAAAKAAGAPTINYGVFINALVDFVIISFALYLVVRQVNRFRGTAVPATKDCPFCASQIPVPATRCPHCTSELGGA